MAQDDGGARQPRVMIVGGGFAGREAAKGLQGSGAEVVLLDRKNHHVFQPLLYQVATTILPISEIAWPLRQMVGGRRDVTTLLGKVVAVDQDARRLRLEGGSELHYDTLVLATGARHSYFGNDAWEPYAPGLKTLEDATNIRRRVLTAFEEAEQTDDPAKREALMTFAVIGAGPTGVELAGVIADLARRVLVERPLPIEQHGGDLGNGGTHGRGYPPRIPWGTDQGGHHDAHALSRSALSPLHLDDRGRSRRPAACDRRRCGDAAGGAGIVRYGLLRRGRTLANHTVQYRN